MYWKFLRAGAVSPFTGFRWTAGCWVDADQTVACAEGIHACRRSDLPYWLVDELWAIELAGPIRPAERKVVAGRARLLHRVDTWTADTARLLAEACVIRTAGHAAAELRASGYQREADRLEGESLDRLDRAAREVLESLAGRGTRRLTKLCGYLVDAIEAMEAYPEAAVAYIAARAANQRGGPVELDRYAAERDWQAKWLVETLRLDAST